MIVVGFINNNDETTFREEVTKPASWCKVNNLSLNADKTKEMIPEKSCSDHTLHHGVGGFCVLFCQI